MFVECTSKCSSGTYAILNETFFRFVSHVQNSADGKLNTQQLCLAYRALVRSAGSFGGAPDAESGVLSAGDAFAWYCVDRLLRAVQSPPGGDTQRNADIAVTSEDQLHRLRLALVSTVPSVSLVLLPRLLESVRGVVTAIARGEGREELVRALFQEIATRVGDEEKEYATRWWYEHKGELLGGVGTTDEKVEVKGKGKARELVARL